MRRMTTALTTLALGATMASAIAANSSARAEPVADRVAAQARPEVVIKVDRTVVEVGHKVTVTGKIEKRRKVAGDRVIIKQKTGDNDWKPQGRVTVTKKGKFTWTDKPTSPTRRKYKVVLPKTKRHAKSVSNAVSVASAEWVNLTRLDGAARSNAYLGRTFVDGQGYPKSIVAGPLWESPIAFHEYNLFGNCFVLRTAAALDDHAETGSAGTARILLDGEEISTTHVAVFGESQPVVLDVADAYRVRFELTPDSTDVRAVMAFVRPELLCTR